MGSRVRASELAGGVDDGGDGEEGGDGDAEAAVAGADGEGGADAGAGDHADDERGGDAPVDVAEQRVGDRRRGWRRAPTHTSDVAMAAFTSMRTKCTKAGTMITPPPMPSRPDSPPATTPIAAQRPAESVPSGRPAGASGASVSASGSSGGIGGAARAIRYDDSSSSAAVSELEEVAVAGHVLGGRAAADRGDQAGRHRRRDRRPADEALAPVAPGAAGRARDDDRQRGADDDDRLEPEQPHARLGDHAAADAEQPRQHAHGEAEDHRDDVAERAHVHRGGSSRPPDRAMDLARDDYVPRSRHGP